MMQIMRWASATVWASVTLIFASSHAMAALDTVQNLLQECRGSPSAICIGYVAGVSETMNTIGNIMKKDEINLEQRKALSLFAQCNDSTVGAAVQAFINWAQAHPERWNYQPAVGLIGALREKWPCR